MTTSQPRMQQPPYIGSKISLISKLDIRYEGTLYTVDAIESTIALAKVHSYGTEDRHTPVFVPPRDEVYDFIIFKASDIKDLIVCEPPKATNLQNPLAAGIPFDPAIISISKNPPPEPKLPTNFNMNLKDNKLGYQQNQHRTYEAFMRRGNANGPDPNAFNGTPLFNYRNTPNINASGRSSRETLVRPIRTEHHQPFFFQTPQNTHQQRASSSRIDGVNGGIQSFIGRSQTPQTRLKFDSDYDFEKANELFREISEELKTKMEKVELTDEKAATNEETTTAVAESVKSVDEHANLEGQQQEKQVEPVDKVESNDSLKEREDEKSLSVVLALELKSEVDERENKEFYNKSASFFDNISCDALEKQSGKNVRPDWKRERQTNQETFGHSAVRSLFYQRRGARGGGYGMAPMRFNYRFPNFQQAQQQPRFQQQQNAGFRHY